MTRGVLLERGVESGREKRGSIAKVEVLIRDDSFFEEIESWYRLYLREGIAPT